MASFTLKQLRYFEALARHKHFGHAADAVSVSQPALSVQIRDLEAALGVALFERGPRQVRLTAFGETFAGRVQGILRSVDELGDLARTAQGGLSGQLRIGVIPTIAPYLLPAILRDVAAAYPDLDVHVRETVTPRLIEALHAGRLDTAILALPVSEPALTEVTLFDERLVLVRPEREAGRPVPDAETLRDMRLLLLEEGHCFRDQALAVCGVAQPGGQEGLDGTSLSTLVQMVGAGLGVTLIPDMAVPVETRSAPVCIGRFAAPQPTRTVGMVWRKTSPLAPDLMQLADIVRQAAQPDTSA